ncbi:hypothetical protein HB662_08955 [Roseomonas frigidaquae]|uniref:HdeA/HdeB family protein n=1 Tax=Falsiroseomonas frigidaquae TaxID=487318 RepID=A0ABX1EXT3_9PROT|nr:hypothetical protein [Falsiroseomonas frigidaquae]NKE44906.1 hypothetical protein [Falsiroseomonas frigidaquae]
MKLILTLLLLALAMPAAAQAPNSRDWNAEKCARYTADWPRALSMFGRQGLSAEFLDRHATFLASGCRSRVEVCPRSPQELALADAMTIAAMNAGTASSFVPFRCGG